MRHVEIISHCFQFSRVLSYQISSLFLHPPKNVEVDLYVFFSRDDKPTQDVIFDAYNRTFPDNVHVFGWPIDTRCLMNRSIGRNMATQDHTSNVFWFCDCDYFFGEGCLDALADIPLDPADPEYSKLYFPKTTLYNKTHANGDEYALRATKPGLYDIDPADFIEHRPGRAIGGIQIVPGDVAREFGYCPDSKKWQEPCDEWKQTGADRLYRKILGTNGKAIALPNCYRIRQVTEGAVDIIPPPSDTVDYSRSATEGFCVIEYRNEVKRRFGKHGPKQLSDCGGVNSQAECGCWVCLSLQWGLGSLNVANTP